MNLTMLFHRILHIGLFIVVCIFNPFTFPGLYIDSTGSFSFVATFKIYLVAILNTVLLAFWIIKIQKTKELNVTPSIMYIPLFLWLISIVSTFFYVG
ncbi:MAG: hypothetical protein KatS3mg084_0536 [Candidatus Dojkabacteria bacterium]|nr:MAG: hypothetical protein KatS3mg084_0536 [Candidatus Dojkabacteria bacterium]